MLLGTGETIEEEDEEVNPPSSAVKAPLKLLKTRSYGLLGTNDNKVIVVRAKDRFNNPTDFGYKDLVGCRDAFAPTATPTSLLASSCS